MGKKDSRQLGSPPQVRGKHGSNRNCRCLVGITPAGAGKTLFAGIPRNQGQDHPRRCGENAPARSSNSPTQGSPPQVRGKLVAVARNYWEAGITPAGAGKTHSRYFCRQRDRDHPRRCGENVRQRVHGDCDRGSPPQVRGKPDSDH